MGKGFLRFMASVSIIAVLAGFISIWNSLPLYGKILSVFVFLIFFIFMIPILNWKIFRRL
jgi:hypothetical protein